MFNKIKALNDARSQAKTIEKALEAVQATGEAKGVKIIINGKQEILSVKIEEGTSHENIEEGVKKAIAEAMKKLQKDIQQAIKDAGGLPDLSSFGM